MKWWRSLLEASDRDAERRAKEGQDKLYAALRASGADARLAPKGRPEGTLVIKEIWGYEDNRSVGLFDIGVSPIRWVNFVDMGFYFDGGFHMVIIHGIPDSRDLPQMSIKVTSVKDAPLWFGQWIVKWSGNDHGTGIKQFLSDSVAVKEAFLTTRLGRDPDFGINVRYLHQQNYWLIIREEEYPLNVDFIGLTKEKWKCYEVIAEHLLTAPIQM